MLIEPGFEEMTSYNEELIRVLLHVRMVSSKFEFIPLSYHHNIHVSTWYNSGSHYGQLTQAINSQLGRMWVVFTTSPSCSTSKFDSSRHVTTSPLLSVGVWVNVLESGSVYIRPFRWHHLYLRKTVMTLVKYCPALPPSLQQSRLLTTETILEIGWA
mgnify:CR=1 FL=1